MTDTDIGKVDAKPMMEEQSKTREYCMIAVGRVITRDSLVRKLDHAVGLKERRST